MSKQHVISWIVLNTNLAVALLWGQFINIVIAMLVCIYITQIEEEAE